MMIRRLLRRLGPCLPLRSREGLAGAAEWPSLLGDAATPEGCASPRPGLRFGPFCRYAVEQGAADVLGVDLSEKMLADARRRGPGLPIRYERADLEKYAPSARPYDLVFSSLAVHYIADFDAPSSAGCGLR